MAQLLKFLLIQHEVFFINMSKVAKRSSNWTENYKCTNVMNYRGHVGYSTSFYTNHRYKMSVLFWWEFSMSCMFLDLIMHNITNRTNQCSWRDVGQICAISMGFLAVIADILAKRHSGWEKRRMAVFTGYWIRDTEISPCLSCDIET